MAERLDEFAGLADIFPGMGEGLAEWVITSSGGQELRLQLAYFGSSPVITPTLPRCWAGTARSV